MSCTDPALKNLVHYSSLLVKGDQGSGNQLLKTQHTNVSVRFRPATTTLKIFLKNTTQDQKSKNMGLTYPVDLLTDFIDVFVYIQHFAKCILILIHELSSFSAVDLALLWRNSQHKS